MVLTLHHDRLAHFIDAGTRSHADPVFERFIARVLTFVEVVCREDRKLLLVVTIIDDVSHRVSNPIGRL